MFTHSFFMRHHPFGWFLSMMLPIMLSLDDGSGGGGGGGSGGGDGGAGAGDAGAGGGDGKGGAGGDAGKGGGGDAGGGKGNLLDKGGSGGGGGDGKGGSGGDGKGGDGKGGKPNTTPFYADLYGADGKLNHAAFDRLPDHLKPHVETFKKYQTVEALLGGMGNLSNLAGKKALAPLPDNAPPEMKAERQALLRQLHGTPEKPEGYGVKKPDNLPAEMWDEGYVGSMVGILHKHNASPALVKELVEADAKAAAGKVDHNGQTEAQAYAREEQTLRTAFGPQFNDKVDLAVRAARTLGLDPKDPIFRNAKVVIAMAKVGEMVSEDRLVSGDSKGGDGMSDRAKAKDIVTNPSNPLHKAYHNENDPQHDEAVRTHSEFNKRAAAVARTRK